MDYDPNFKLFLTTKLANPHYLPEICITTTLINFTVTREVSPGVAVQQARAKQTDKLPWCSVLLWGD